MTSGAFIPGLELSERFFKELIEPLLRAAMPELRYAAALIGPGSDVLGFDTSMSMYHNWGPRVQIFLAEHGFEEEKGAVASLLRTSLPSTFDSHDLLTQAAGGEASPYSSITVSTFERFFQGLGIDVAKQLGPADWLVIPEQVLRTVTAGRVFRDDLGLEAIRARFNYYPRDVWLYQLAATWHRIGQEEHLMGRAGSVGDEIGSAIIGARLVRDLMRLCFLMERQYAAYPKWFGSAFERLVCAAELRPSLQSALAAGLGE